MWWSQNMIESKRLLLIPIDIDIIDSLLESDDAFLSKYGYINHGGEYLNPSPDYLRNIKNRLIVLSNFFCLFVLFSWQHQCPGTDFSISAEQATPKVSDLKPQFIPLFQFCGWTGLSWVVLTQLQSVVGWGWSLLKVQLLLQLLSEWKLHRQFLISDL